ncbi:chaoptin isoform X2 [Homalodisca vitripennis]|nr:chaoptin isoform X2 [Homalodisca vitripennis]
MKSNIWSGVFLAAACVLASLPCSYSGYIPPGPRYPCPTDPVHAQFLYPCNCTAGTDAGLYVTCEKTNLASLSVGLANLASVGYPVEQLTISSCYFAHLYGDLLYSLKVRMLRFIDTPIRTIKPLTFLGVNRTLQELHIINSSLQEFPKDAFSNLGNLTVLNIDGHRISGLTKDSFSATMIPNQLQRLSIVNGPLKDLPGDTLAPCKRLKRLDLHNNSLSVLQRGQFKGLRDVEFLDLSFNNISKIDHMADLTKMGWCNFSHNTIPDITSRAFARNAVLRSLSLSYNKLRKIDSSSFRGMRLIRRLYLSDNNIKEVGRGTFDNLARIGTIDLARNQIKKIDFQMFNRLQYVELIDVSSNLVTEIKKHAFKELYLVHINLSYNAIAKIEPYAFENCANITVLDMSHNKIANFPKNAFDEITYATEFQLSYNFLTDLSQVPLANMTGIKVLNVSHNEIAVIPRNTFPKLYELHTIDVSYNNLSNIAVTVFQTLFSLRTLLLDHNSLEEIKSGTFGTLPTLLHLDLSHNRLNKVNRQAFNRLPSLRTMTLRHNTLEMLFDIPQSLSHIDVSHNFITFETPTKWPSMNSLLSINLSHNLIGDNLVTESLSPLLTLQSLDLSYNGISLPPKDALSSLPSLQHLNMEDNEIEILEKQSFGTLPIMSELNLARNQILTLKDDAFLGLKQLIILNLSGNNVSVISNSAFRDLVALRTLDLSHNQIESLDNKTNSIFEDLLSLENLNLSDNKISFLTRKSFPSSQWVPYRLKHLDLSFNVMPVLTYELTFGTRKLISLNISHNMITEIRKSVLGNLTSLEVLDLSNNLIDDLTAQNVFVLPSQLTYLSLAYNSLHAFPLNSILKTHTLKHLDLRYNQLEQFYNELLPMIRNGTHIYYNGNPTSCDCTLRPVRRWALSLLTPDPAWAEFQCQDSEFTNTSIIDIPEKFLACNNTEEDENEDLQLTPDVKFRHVHFLKDGGVRSTWFVNMKTDVADFRLVVLGNGSHTQDGWKESIWEKIEPYNTRSDTFYTLPKHQEGARLCIMGMSSEGNTNPLLPSQCQSLPCISGSVSSSHQSQWPFVISLILLSMRFVLC